jgi:methyl-accepting chemotaxis protein
MARERVVINIEVNSDIATIEATRAALERLTKQNRDLNDEYDRHKKRITEVTKENKRLNRDSDMVGNSLRNLGKHTATSSRRFAGLRKSVLSLRKDIGTLISAFGGMIGVVNKLSLIEIPLLALGMAGITSLFKSGTGFVNLYRAAMSSLAYTAAGVGVAVTTVISALREFQSVQFAPMYVDGAINTEDRFAAASGAMRMFVDNTRLAVVGSESLQKAFGTLSKQKPVTGGTVAAFEGLMNIVAGSGGDIGKGSEKLATFLAQVQKGGLGSAASAAKDLGPDFEKIIKEAQALGLKTSDEFFKAAADGALGETFQKKYAGQLDALNDTLIGRFKTALQSTKNLLGDIGDQFLQPTGEAVIKIQRIIERTILQLTPMLRQFGTDTFLGDVVNLIDKVSVKFVGLMNKYLGTTPGLFEKLGEYMDAIGKRFEKVQDWARQFVDAGQLITDNFIKPIFEGLMDKFGGGMNVLASLVEANAPLLRSLADSIVDVIAAIGEYGNMLKEAFIAVIPLLNVFLKVTEKIFSIWTKISKGLLSVFGGIGGGIGKALAAVPVLYGSLILFSRFFKVFGGMFGKDMSIKANNVFVNGRGIGGGPMGGPMGGPGGRPMGGPGIRGRMGYSYNLARNSGVGIARSAQAGLRSGYAGVKGLGGSGAFNQLYGLGNMGLMLGGTALMGAGQKMGGTSTAGGAALTGLGAAANLGAAGSMLGLGELTFGTGSAVGTGAILGGAAAIGGGYAAGSYIGSKFTDDSVRSRAMSAATSAAVGAAIGSVVPGIGTAVGAGLGAVVGGAVGYWKAGAARRDARKAAKGVMDNFFMETEDAFAAGDVEKLKAQLEGLNAEIAKAATGDIDYYNKKIDEQRKKIDETAKQIDNYSRNADLAERMFGKSTDALNKLAEEAGINVRDKVLNFTEMLKLVGKTSEEQTRLVKQFWGTLGGQALGGALGKLDKIRERRDTQNALDASQASLLGGNVSGENLLSFVENQIKFSTAEYGELGGLANAYESIIAGLSGETLGKLDDKTKEKLMALANDILDPTALVKSMDQEMLATMVGGASALAGMSSSDILSLVNQKMKTDPNFLANFGAYQSRNNMTQMNAMITGQGGIVGASSPYGFMPQITVNVNAPVIDPEVVRQIRLELEASLRTAREKGGTFTGGAGTFRR